MARPIAKALLAVLLAAGSNAHAGPASSTSTPPDPSAEAPPSPEVEKARALFKEGVELVKQARWSNALAAFEASNTLRPHATTAFNIGACERAMGRYTRARLHFADALARNGQNPGELAPSLEDEAKGFVAEIDRLLVRVDVTLDPATAAVAVDGRPLHALASGGGTLFVGGIEEPGRGRVLGPAHFSMELDPGAHVIVLSRTGYADAVVNRTFSPGSTSRLELVLARLPATLDISSNIAGAIVAVNGHDFGPVPVTVLRPAGTYRVTVTKDGYDAYEAQVAAHAGEHVNLRARLVETTTPITKRWWFWTGAAAVLAGGAFATYELTRPEPSPPPYNGGSIDWVVSPSHIRF